MSDRCPLCDEPNECQMAAGAPNADACWCSATRIPADLRARVTLAHRGTACICAACVAEYVENASWPSLASVVQARLSRVRHDR
jgi:hypothetical protein